MVGRIDLSTTVPQTTPPTENLQSEIATVVRVNGQAFVFSSGGGPTLQAVRATNPAAPALVARTAYGNVAPAASVVWVSQAVASFGSLLAVALSPGDYATNAGRGIVRFYRVQPGGALLFLQDVAVGYLPDSLAFLQPVIDWGTWPALVSAALAIAALALALPAVPLLA